MPRRLHCAIVTGAFLVAWPAFGQIVDNARRVAATPWDDRKMTADVVRLCGIPRAYFSVKRDFDGFARLMESPSVTGDQHKCATRIVESQRIPIRK